MFKQGQYNIYYLHVLQSKRMICKNEKKLCSNRDSITSTIYIPSKQLAAFPHRLIAHWWKKNDACHYDFRQTAERMLAELRFELTAP